MKVFSWALTQAEGLDSSERLNKFMLRKKLSKEIDFQENVLWAACSKYSDYSLDNVVYVFQN